jgi:hypothetical protein
LIKLPAALAITVAANVHTALALIVAPVICRVPAPGFPVIVAPEHPAPVNVGFAGFASVMPAGKVSNRLTPVSANAPGLSFKICSDRFDVLPRGTVIGLNPLPRLTVVLDAVSVAVAAVGLLASSAVVRLPIGIVFVEIPFDPFGAVTLTPIAHEVAAAPPLNVPPARLITFVPDAAVSVPPHVFVGAGDAAIVAANAEVGNVSEKLKLVSAAAFAVRVTVIVSREF